MLISRAAPGTNVVTSEMIDAAKIGHKNDMQVHRLLKSTYEKQSG